MLGILWRWDSAAELRLRGGVPARGGATGGGVEVHVCPQAQGHADLQPLRLPQVGRHGLVSGEPGPQVGRCPDIQLVVNIGCGVIGSF